MTATRTDNEGAFPIVHRSRRRSRPPKCGAVSCALKGRVMLAQGAAGALGLRDMQKDPPREAGRTVGPRGLVVRLASRTSFACCFAIPGLHRVPEIASRSRCPVSPWASMKRPFRARDPLCSRGEDIAPQAEG